MKARAFFIWAVGLCLSCTQLPPLQQPHDPSPGQNPCQTIPFMKRSWQLVHTIQADLPRGKKSALIGVTNVHPEDETVHCVMMSVEGLVILDARHDGVLTINQAVPPFDNERFAQGVIDDVRMVFFPPKNDTPIQSGISADGLPACRYVTANGGVTDVVHSAGNRWLIRRYRQRAQLDRLVTIAMRRLSIGTEECYAPAVVEILSPGTLGYRLRLDLIEVHPLAGR